ncbi:hypothetical protein ERO13_A10G064100v2 [Gossypium hirsutum]|uniref:Epidermal patterning factor-like protein n=2 Tax=Gossypium TaxID=3633 RepID=A0A2P5WRQ0_GOSBA|nr:hypothetical protein ES319_A10G068300v1 [Gossypium barbadense]KAG4178773.1 hypothetical protein ERO13_A10G064100v2 [Gossypium hirsutum]PPR93782.1 hypothetical protein GOBAR_AA26899 [Gossypium barbadense]TYG97882.1 hypothetical protein ES288_A10G073100v1 [Gossypium darwinii]
MAGDNSTSVLIALVIFSLVLSPMLPCAMSRRHVYCPACVCCGPPPPGGGCCSCRCASVESTTPSQTGTP